MPRSQSSIIHPHLLRALPNHFNSDVSLGTPVKTQDDYSQEIIAYVPVPYLQGLRGYKEALMRVEGEQQHQTYVVVEGMFVLQLQGYYPTITREMQAIVDGRSYNVTTVTHDDTKTLTTLSLESVNKQSEQPYSDV